MLPECGPIFRHIGNSVFIIDTKGVILLSSKSVYDLPGMSYDVVVSHDLTDHFTADNKSDWENLIARHNEDDEGSIHTTVFESIVGHGSGLRLLSNGP